MRCACGALRCARGASQAVWAWRVAVLRHAYGWRVCALMDLGVHIDWVRALMDGVCVWARVP